MDWFRYDDGLHHERVEMKTTEWHNVLKPTENKLKMKICLLTLYLNDFNENKVMFGRALKKLICFISSAV